MSKDNIRFSINSREYWDDRFEGDWEDMQGKEQTAFFAEVALRLMPSWLKAEIISEKLGIKKAMILASFIYALALIYLSVNPSITSCYIVVALFAVADSFGLSAQAVYFSSLPEVEKVGQSKALGLNNTIESITTACGSLVFGAVLTLGTQKGILIIAAVFSVMLGLFMLFGKNRIRKEI